MLHVALSILYENSPYQKSHTFDQKSLIHYRNRPTFNQKSPTFYQKSPIFYQKRTILYPKSPIFNKKSPAMYQKSPTFYQKSPTFYQKEPYILSKEPYILSEDLHRGRLESCYTLPFRHTTCTQREGEDERETQRERVCVRKRACGLMCACVFVNVFESCYAKSFGSATYSLFAGTCTEREQDRERAVPPVDHPTKKPPGEVPCHLTSLCRSSDRM